MAEETKEKLRIKRTGVIVSADTKNKLRLLNKGVYRGSKEKPIYQYDLKGNFISRWSSAKEASKSLNISKQAIVFCCNQQDRISVSHKYHWSYTNKGQVIDNFVLYDTRKGRKR